MSPLAAVNSYVPTAVLSARLTLCGTSNVNAPRWVAFPVASTSACTNGGVNGVMVTSPSRLPLKGTGSPAAAGRASPRATTATSARLAAGRKRFIRPLHVVCGTVEGHLPGAQTGRRGGAGPVGGLLGGKDPTGRFRRLSTSTNLRPARPR